MTLACLGPTDVQCLMGLHATAFLQRQVLILHVARYVETMDEVTLTTARPRWGFELTISFGLENKATTLHHDTHTHTHTHTHISGVRCFFFGSGWSPILFRMV